MRRDEMKLKMKKKDQDEKLKKDKNLFFVFALSYHISHAVVGVAISMISGAIQYGLPATS